MTTTFGISVRGSRIRRWSCCWPTNRRAAKFLPAHPRPLEGCSPACVDCRDLYSGGVARRFVGRGRHPHLVGQVPGQVTVVRVPAAGDACDGDVVAVAVRDRPPRQLGGDTFASAAAVGGCDRCRVVVDVGASCGRSFNSGRGSFPSSKLGTCRVQGAGNCPGIVSSTASFAKVVGRLAPRSGTPAVQEGQLPRFWRRRA